MMSQESAEAQPTSSAMALSALDRRQLAQQTLGDRKLEHELLRLFRRQARTMLFRLDTTTHPAGRSEIAHTLKGAAKAIGADRVAAAAEQVETQAREGRPVGVAPLVEEIAAAMVEIDAMLAEAA